VRLGDPSVGLVTELAIYTFPPDLATPQRDRDFAAWLGLLQKQHLSLGGKNTLAFANKMLHD
jgi:transposase